MAEVTKNLGQSCPVAATPNALYTVPANKSAVISRMSVCNQNTADARVRVWIGLAGAGTNVIQYKEWDMLVFAGFPAPDRLIGECLSAGDVVHVQSDIGGVSFNISGSER